MNSATYTTDDEFDELADKDMTTEIIGFVDEVNAPVEVGQTKKFQLFKFVVTNGNKRIICLVWGLNLIEKYKSKVVVNTIIHIEAATCKAVSSNYYKKNVGLVPFELIIREDTIINFLGSHKPFNSPLVKVASVDFDSITDATGTVCISGFVKTNFMSCKSNNGLSSFGIGSITNGSKKVNVRISNFNSNETIKKGDNVTVTGMLQKYGFITILCSNWDNIKLNSDVAKMSENELKKGVRTPKRKLRESNDIETNQSEEAVHDEISEKDG